MDQHDIRRAIARLTPGQALTLARQARAELDRREARRRHSNPGRICLEVNFRNIFRKPQAKRRATPVPRPPDRPEIALKSTLRRGVPGRPECHPGGDPGGV